MNTFRNGCFRTPLGILTEFITPHPPAISIHLSWKLRLNAYRSVTEMVFTQEMQRVDRELFFELTESPISSSFIHMFIPFPPIALRRINLWSTHLFSCALFFLTRRRIPVLRQRVDEHGKIRLITGKPAYWSWAPLLFINNLIQIGRIGRFVLCFPVCCILHLKKKTLYRRLSF